MEFYDVNSNAIKNGTVFYGLRPKAGSVITTYQPAIFPTKEDALEYLRVSYLTRYYDTVPVMYIHHNEEV